MVATMTGMPRTPSLRGGFGAAVSRASSKAADENKPQNAAPLEVAVPLSDDRSESSKRTASPLVRMKSMGKSLFERAASRRAPPVGAATVAPTGAADASAVAEPEEAATLLLAVKPFGKDGVRLGWQSAQELGEGAELHVEFCLDGADVWTAHSELPAAGKASGVHVIKPVPGETPPPSKRRWRIRSSAGEVSAGARLGERPKGGRTASGVFAAGKGGGTGGAGGALAAPSAGGAPATATVSSGPAAAPSASASVAGLDEPALLSLLQSRSGEVDCLLRVSLQSDDEICNARHAVDEALAFDAELDRLALSCGVIKGRLFQALLEALRAMGAGHSQMDNSVKNLGGLTGGREFGLSLVEWSTLTLAADSLRNLVRIKVADDNDLSTARSGLVLCAQYFHALSRLASLRGATSEFALVQALHAC